MFYLLEVKQPDFPNIVIKGSELQRSFQVCLKTKQFGEPIFKAIEPQMVLFNIYRDWLKIISSGTTYLRLILILRALQVKNEKGQSYECVDRALMTWSVNEVENCGGGCCIGLIIPR